MVMSELNLTGRICFAIICSHRRGVGEKGNKNLLSGVIAMKMKWWVFPFILVCISVAISLADYSDGYITAGEYEYGVRWFSNNPPLIVEGGGADIIEVRDFGRLQVRYTSTPITNDTGIWDILVDDYSQLLYLGGMTEEITMDENATATLKGGRIDYITSMQSATTKHIDLYCRPGWSWISDNSLLGVEGLWQDGSSFSIEFINDSDYDPVWKNINIIEIPEPATMLLLGLGGLLMRKW